MEDESKISRQQKIIAATLAGASLAFVASMYLIAEDEEDEDENIFRDACDLQDIKKIWLEYNRENHPDKVKLSGDALYAHMEEYHRIKDIYEQKIREYS